MKKKLNKNRPYGEIHGASIAKFEQDGYYFDAHGLEIGGQTDFTCVCGRSFTTERGLNLHVGRNGCQQK